MKKPDYSGLLDYDQDWLRSMHGNVRETLPEKCPTPRSKIVCMMAYKDTVLYHNMCTGRAVTGVLHFIDKPPIDWYSKKQSTVETATYGLVHLGKDSHPANTRAANDPHLLMPPLTCLVTMGQW
jgi:hypothetical protein